MKRTLLVILALSPFFLQAQPRPRAKKYPSLLWEISGNGLKKPSYLFGTMHVSSKIAFHLADSFYLGIRHADVVALETNPESWQEDMSRFEAGSSGFRQGGRYEGDNAAPNDYLSINTLKFFKYDKKIERSLYSNPSTINNLLYRSYGNESSDFEEDTYLDMYIYQCGKKWGKKVAGVEKYAESMKLMQEAYRDAARERNKKDRSFDVEEEYSSGKLQEAYRKGNLDQLDSINKLNSFSDAFDEKFLYRRNEIQAGSIDSILRSKSTLFVGVGAAHLPGERGVIELLRKMGYKLRPVMMSERDSRHKDEVEKVRVPVSFNTEQSEDGLFQVSIPGRFYKFGDDGALDQRQYADMANGSYYMVTRVMTNAWMWGQGPAEVYKKTDSLLYENIPGKIISKTRISRNGYPGFDIMNRTRRGDLQRYQIYVTPFEVIFFKMSGNGEYVKNGVEAQTFFGSIRFREYRPAGGWIKYSPPGGGFSARFPHEPYTGNDGSWIFDATDRETGTSYRVVRSDIHNYHFAEEDSFDLGLMDESFAASEFIDKRIYRQFTRHHGYPALDCRYRDKNGALFLTRFIIRGPHYYTLVAYGKKEIPGMRAFLDSFMIQPFTYGEAKAWRDSSLYFSVKSPVIPSQEKEKLEIPRFSLFGSGEEAEESSEKDQLEEGVYRSRLFANDTTGEKIFVSFYKAPRYYYRKDSLDRENREEISILGDTSWIVRSKKTWQLPGGIKVRDAVVTDSGSSRAFRIRRFYRNGISFSLLAQIDTLSPPSAFIKNFYDSFSPADTLAGVNPYTKKSGIFFADFMSRDSVAHKRAVKNISMIGLDSSDLPDLERVIQSLSFDERNYLETKKALIAKLEDIKIKRASDYLGEIYFAAGDTIELQYTALEALLRQQTRYAFGVFRDIMSTDPPVLEKKTGGDWDYLRIPRARRVNIMYNEEGFLDELNDSLQLTRDIMPDLLPLLNLDDYKKPVMRLLALLVDSNLVTARDYESYYSRFLVEAKQEMKKQLIAEKRKAIEQAEENKMEKKTTTFTANSNLDRGNEVLELYATLLLPFWDKQPPVQTLFRQMLQSTDRQLVYNTLLHLVRNNKPYPDSLIRYFAGLDEFRYALYSDLRLAGKAGKFPAKQNNHLDLGRSLLLEKKIYGKPDTISYIDRRLADVRGKKGYIYFYKYKNKKEDMSWKLAAVGLVPTDPQLFEFEEDEPIESRILSFLLPYPGSPRSGAFDFTNLSETKLRDDEPVAEQLNKELKKLLYSKRNSAKEFYGDNTPESRYDYVIGANDD